VQTTVVDTASAFVEFIVYYKKNKDLGELVHSDAISTGGHTWRNGGYPTTRRGIIFTSCSSF
jgi:hypothetical protein